MPKLTFQWNSVPKLTLAAEVHRLVPKLFHAEVTRAEHRLPPRNAEYIIFVSKFDDQNCNQNPIWLLKNFSAGKIMVLC